jgi:hypothetical protein
MNGCAMSKTKNSTPGNVDESASPRQTDKKRVRRAIFKADEWYAGAALSIGIAGRPKGARPPQLFMARVDEKAD